MADSGEEYVVYGRMRKVVQFPLMIYATICTSGDF